jgi:hypothetical protein
LLPLYSPFLLASPAGRNALPLGVHGDIQISRQKFEDGKWRAVPRGGDRIRARTKYRKHDGAYTELSAYGKTGRLAETALQRKIEKQSGHGSDRLTGKTLLVDAGRVWLDEIARPDSGLSPRRVDDYSRSFRRYVETGSLRGLTLAEADDPARITAYLRQIADRHGSVKMVRTVLRHIFDLAVRYRALKSSPMRDVRLVRSTTPKETLRDTTRAFTREERDEVSFAYSAAEEAQGRKPRTAWSPWSIRRPFLITSRRQDMCAFARKSAPCLLYALAA